MAEIKGKYLREEEIFDPELRELLGDRYRDRTLEEPVEQEKVEQLEDTEEGFFAKLRYPALFLALVAFIGASGHLGLMDAVIAVPGMCVCSACFGWTARWR